MDVSVVVPTRNRCALLTTTLRSVLRQQDVDFEVIVVDEASTDDTLAVITALGDPRVRIIRHDSPRGVATARNCGGMAGQGEWVTFIDDDDLWAPDKLVRQLQAAQALGRNWAYTGSVNIIDDCRVVFGKPPLSPEEVVTALLRYDAVPGGGSNVIVRRETWLLAGPFDTRLRNTEDWEMWIRLAKLGLPACVSSPMVARRLHSSNSSLDIAEIVKGTKLIESIHHTTADWGRLHLWMAQMSLRSSRRYAALGHYARAAVHGEMRGVAADLSAIVQRRYGGTMRPADDQHASANAAWTMAAEAWLAEFKEIQGSSMLFT